MTAAPLDLYDSAISGHTSSDGRSRSPWQLRYADGRVRALEIGRWCGEPDAVDLRILERCVDPTLDIGCGPGRLVTTLNAAGRTAVGVDFAGAAVEIARNAGGAVIHQSVFDPLPDEGCWRTALLIDGNIGIGGNPVRLLRRCRQLLAPDGVVIVELDPPGVGSIATKVRLESRQRRSQWFDWAHVAANEIAGPAAATGLRVVDAWAAEGRWFGHLAR